MVKLCDHRLKKNRACSCELQSSNWRLIFRFDGRMRPGSRFTPDNLYCDDEMSDVCPFREHTPEDRTPHPLDLVECPYCKRRHIRDSAASKYCEAYNKAIKLFEGMALYGESWTPEGTTEDPFEGTEITPYWREILWDRIRYQVFKRDKHTCQDCGLQCDPNSTMKKIIDEEGDLKWINFEVHHIIPRSKGGHHHPKNLKLLCQECHSHYTAGLHRENAVERKSEKFKEKNKMNRRLEEFD
jgi:5-methylcytosine-specific restriction endonuclease McrA